ncbi:hypothetical protein T02_9511 [Trichinella nativa]|uniref:Uncharacterized protein n=1 Tax=Trichinella nativa TaxID=6335 RepID=A0A0V1KY71_9BILA|nr:hypothetical protein T02_9511 [Trichinella nativa]
MPPSKRDRGQKINANGEDSRGNPERRPICKSIALQSFNNIAIEKFINYNESRLEYDSKFHKFVKSLGQIFSPLTAR